MIPPPRDGYFRASDTSARLIPPPRDTCASDTSSARLILSIYPPARPPPLPSILLRGPPPLAYAPSAACGSYLSARLIPFPRDTSVRMIPPPRDASRGIRSRGIPPARDTSARLLPPLYPPARPPPPLRVRSLSSARLIPLRASDTSPAGYLRAPDTSPAGYLRASDTF